MNCRPPARTVPRAAASDGGNFADATGRAAQQFTQRRKLHINLIVIIEKNSDIRSELRVLLDERVAIRHSVCAACVRTCGDNDINRFFKSFVEHTYALDSNCSRSKRKPRFRSPATAAGVRSII